MRATAMIRDVTIRANTEGVSETKAKVDALAGSTDRLAVSEERQTKARLSVEASYDRLRRQMDETYRQSRQFEAGQRVLDRALEASRITTVEYARDMDLLNARYSLAGRANDNFSKATAGAAKSAGLARHELINLGRQAQDVGTMFAMGASPMQVFASQAAQIGDIFMSTSGTMGGFLKQLGGGIARFATSGLGLASAAGAVGLWGATAASGYASGQREIEASLRGVGAASGATLDGINRLADAQAAAARVSRSSAREIASAYAGTGRVNPTQLPGLLDFTKQFGAMQGLGTDEAAKFLAGAFADPSKGAEQLAEKLGGLNSASLRWIQSQQAAGDLLGAQRALFITFQQQVAGSTERVGLFARSWDLLKSSVSDADDALGRALNGPTDSERLTTLLKQRERLQASAGPGSIGVNNQLRMLEMQIRPLEAIVELQRQREAIDERTAKAGNASLAASAISDHLDSNRKDMEELVKLQTKLDEARKLNKGAPEYEEWGKALDRVKGAIETLLPSAERERQAHDLTLRAINARTLAERTAIEVARETLRLSGEKVSATEREAAAQRKAAEVQAQANRDAQDALRASRDQLALSGLRPGDRFKVEQELRLRDNTEKFGGHGSIDRNTLLDAIEKFESGGRNVRNYRYDSTHTAQGNFQITNTTWRDIAKAAGINLGQYPTAETAPYELQRRAANALIDARGVQPWAPHNPALRNWLGSNGGDGTSRAINDNFAQSRERDMHLSVIGGAEDDLKRQAAALDIQRQAFGRSTEELARQNAEQDLFNKLVAAGGQDLASKFTPEIQQLAQRYGELAGKREEMARLQDTMRDFNDIGRDALKGFISDLRNGKSAAEALKNSLDRVLDKMLDMAINSLFDFGGKGGGGLLGWLTRPLTASANGNVFDGAGIQRFALGGAFTNSIVDRPTLFPFANGVGLMGEAGPEAIMPLRRGSDGRLGVSAPNYRTPPHVAPPQASSAVGGPVSVQIVNKTTGQVQGTAKTERGSDGSLNVLVELIEVVEAGIADRAASGRSPLNDVFQRDARTMRG